MRRFPALFAGALAALALASVARADGEAGLVIQDGETVTTYCIPFQGDSISGEQLLASAGLPIEKFGGGSGVVVCAIGATGCFDPSSFDSCFCQCRGNDCTYWAFFTRQYGKNWVYSSLGVALARARDGELHAWKWGKGGPSSAPAPSNDITFEQVCGHPPRGGAPAPTPTFTPSLPSPASTLPASPAPTLPPSPVLTLQPSPTSNLQPSPTSNLQPSSTSTLQPPTSTLQPPTSSSSRPWFAFGVIAGVLLLGIAAAAAWRVRRGR